MSTNCLKHTICDIFTTCKWHPLHVMNQWETYYNIFVKHLYAPYLSAEWTENTAVIRRQQLILVDNVAVVRRLSTTAYLMSTITCMHYMNNAGLPVLQATVQATQQWTSRQSNLTKRLHCRCTWIGRLTGDINVHSHLIRASLDLPKSISQTTSQLGSAIFAQLTAESPYTLQWAAFPPKIAPPQQWDLDPI